MADNKSVFNFSKSHAGKSRKALYVNELKEHLKVLVRQAVVKDKESDIARHLLVGKRVKHRFNTDDGEKWYTGKVISQIKKRHKTKKNTFLLTVLIYFNTIILYLFWFFVTIILHG